MSSPKLALITGATAGIGEATARELAKQGYSLMLTGRREERLQKICSELKQKYSAQDFSFANFDIQEAKAVQTFVEKHSAQLKGLSVLVNNAGLARGSEKMQEGQIADWEEMIDTNIKGLLWLTRAVLPYMVKNDSGHIVNMGSVAGRWVYPGGAVYCATKFAVRALSEGLRLDLLGKNIRVTNIEPGMVETEFSLVRWGDAEKAKQVYAGMKPLTASDIAETISWVVSRPSHVNIQELVIYPTDQASVQNVHRR